jgi:hypothetical protein
MKEIADLADLLLGGIMDHINAICNEQTQKTKNRSKP